MADASDFVQRFTEWWRAPNLETLHTLLGSDVVLDQPTMPRTVGFEAGRRGMGRLLAAVPDLHAIVHRSAAQGDTVFIEFTLAGTFGGTPIAWENVDRITLGPDGLATERINYHDSAALAGQLVRRPRGWRALLRSGMLKRR